MTHRILLFKNGTQDDISSCEALDRAFDLRWNGHAVITKYKANDITDEMWIDFNTEEEAALWKLTHL